MTEAPNGPGRWFDERARSAAAAGRPGDSLPAWSGWGFLLCATVAIGYGLWTLYGSGSRVAILDATAEPARPAASSPAPPPSPAGASPGVPVETLGAPAGALGPVSLDPRMNPLRAVLRAAYAPVGSKRFRYEIELVDAAGRRLWERHGALGNRDDEASIVKTTTSLGDFDVAEPGDYFARVRMTSGGMDDLRDATLELRRNVLRVDPRIPWGFGLAALACLIVNLAASRRRPWPYRLPEDERTAA